MTVKRVGSNSPSRDLRRRIALSNRARLSVGPAKLETVTAGLAASRRERARFIKDPTAYLKANALPVSSCRLVRPSERRAQTSEIISTYINCLVNVCSTVWVIIDACAFVTCENRAFAVVAAAGYEAGSQKSAGDADLPSSGPFDPRQIDVL